MWTLIRLLWVHTVCKNDFKNHKQMTKQTTIVVTGALRVKSSRFLEKDNVFQIFLALRNDNYPLTAPLSVRVYICA